MNKIILTLGFFAALFTSVFAQDVYDKKGAFEENGMRWALVEKDGKYGFIDSTERVVVPIEFDSFGEFGSCGIMWMIVEKQNKFGYIDQNGTVVVPVEYDGFGKFGDCGEMWLLAEKENKFGFIDDDGQVIVPVEYDSFGEFGDFGLDYILTQKDGKHGFYDREGNIKVPVIHETMSDAFPKEELSKDIKEDSSSFSIGDVTISFDFDDDEMSDDDHKEFKGFGSYYDPRISMFSMGVNSLYNVDYSGYNTDVQFLDVREQVSYEVGLILCDAGFKMTEWMGLGFGIGFTWNNYKFEHPYTFRSDSTFKVQPILIEGNVDKTKLTTVFIDIPMMLEFNINNDFIVSAGVIGGVNIGSHTKVKVDGNKSKNKVGLNIQPFRYGYSAMIGTDDLTIKGTYYASELFEKGEGPAANPFSISLALIL